MYPVQMPSLMNLIFASREQHFLTHRDWANNLHSDHTEFLSHSAPIPACRETGFDEMVKKPKDEAFIQSEQMLWLYAGQNEAKLCFC